MLLVRPKTDLVTVTGLRQKPADVLRQLAHFFGDLVVQRGLIPHKASPFPQRNTNRSSLRVHPPHSLGGRRRVLSQLSQTLLESGFQILEFRHPVMFLTEGKSENSFAHSARLRPPYGAAQR